MVLTVNWPWHLQAKGTKIARQALKLSNDLGGQKSDLYVCDFYKPICILTHQDLIKSCHHIQFSDFRCL